MHSLKKVLIVIFSSSFCFAQAQQLRSLDHRSVEFLENSEDLHCGIRPYLTKDTSAKGCLGAFVPLAWSAGYDAADSKLLYNGSTGASITLRYPKKKFYGIFSTLVTPPSSSPSFQDSLMKYSGYYPGMGRAYHDGDSKYASESFEGYVSWSPGNVFNFQAGKGRHFWGDGYRSLWLSDAASAYPYLSIRANVWKINYQVLYAMHSDQSAGTGLQADFRNKFGVFHILSWNATKKWNFSLFETVVWQGSDTNRTRHFDVNYLNPVIFFRPVEYSLGSSDNSMIGFSLRHKPCHCFHWYVQTMFDEFYMKEIRADLSELISPDDTVDSGWWANKWGLQLGWKAYDVLKVKGLFLNQELNMVRPFTYAHGSVQQNYGHAGLSLAHPLGSNFMELVNRVRYEFKTLKYGVEAFAIIAKAGRDSLGANTGGDIFQSYAGRDREYGNYFLQGDRETILNAGLLFYYYGFPIKGVVAEAGFRYRSQERSTYSRQNAWFFISLKTDLRNFYSDY